MKEFFSGTPHRGAFLWHFRRELTAMLSLPWGEDRHLSQRLPPAPAPGSRWRRWALCWRAAPLIVQGRISGGKPQHPLKDRAGADLRGGVRLRAGAVLNVSVEAESAVTVMFLHIRRVLSVCPSACSHHSRIIRNLLGELAEKNLRLNEKLTHMGQRTTRAKLMSYFSAEAQRRGWL